MTGLADISTSVDTLSNTYYTVVPSLSPPMSAPQFYLVADGNAFALDDDGTPFGAPVNIDGTVDWDCSYDFDPNEEDVEYVAHMCYYLKQAEQLHQEHNSEVFVK